MTRLLALLLILVPWPAAAANICDYWPTIQAGRQQIVQFQATQGTAQWLGLTQRYVNRGSVGGYPVLRLDDFNSTGWLDAWEMRCDSGRGWLEVADHFPGGNHKVYTVGKEIPWGGTVEVGQVINLPVHVNVAASTGETSGIHNWGRQILTFEELLPTMTLPSGLVFDNVLKVHLLHSWCKANSDCSYPANQWTWKVRYWFAPGVGIVQIQYLQSPNQTFDPPRIDYAKAVIVTHEMP